MISGQSDYNFRSLQVPSDSSKSFLAEVLQDLQTNNTGFDMKIILFKLVCQTESA
jgi:hypothetical protein